MIFSMFCHQTFVNACSVKNDVIIMCRTGVEVGTDEAIYQDFRVCRHAIWPWLEYFTLHHATFQSH